MMKRLSKVARELNVGIKTIIDFLEPLGYHLNNNPNEKVSDEIYEILIKEFSYYMKERKKSDEIYLEKILPKNNVRDQLNKESNRNVSENLTSSDIRKTAIHNKKQNISIKNISENELIKNNPKVFISYSWDNEIHKSWVENFARVLIANGIVTILDQYELSIGDNLQFFMETHIPDVEKVIIILTPNYKKKAEKRHGGVGYEYSIITQELFNNQNSNKFIPVQKEGEIEECVPTFLKGRLFLDMRNKNQFRSGLKQIIYSVYNKRMIEKPALGEIPDFKNLNFNL